MIAVITITVVMIVLSIISIIQWNKNVKRITELEKLLDEYYKRRENRIISKFRDMDNIQ